jgi:hypothetical protein
VGGPLQGTDGTATYQIGSDTTLTTTLHWIDPLAFNNTFTETAPAGFVASAHGPDRGSTINANFAITQNLAGRTFLPNASNWTAIDPGAIFLTAGPGFGGFPTVSGRVTGLAVDPTNDIIFAATAGGGVWEDHSNSAGNKPDSLAGNSAGNWVPLTDHLNDSAGNPVPEFMGAIALAPSNPQVIYAGTGEANNGADDNWGEGILVSTDGGSSFTLTGQAQLQGTAISKIVVDPLDPRIAWAAVCNNPTNGTSASVTGIYQTTDGGGTWKNLTLANGKDSMDPWSDLVIDPTTTATGSSSATLYAAVGNPAGSASNGVYESLDSGATWNLLTNVPASTGAGRISLALSHPAGTANQALYVLMATQQNTTTGAANLLAFDVSPNGGANWTQQPNPNPDPFAAAGQGWYDNVVEADPNTPTTVYLGGQAGQNSLLESTNGGANWTDISGFTAITNVSNTPSPTITTSTPHQLFQNERITITGVKGATGVDGTFFVASVPSPTTFTITAPAPGMYMSGGAVNSLGVPHADHHALLVDGTGRLLDGNDGGVWRLDSINLPSFSWEDLNGWETVNAPGLSINQVTGIALEPGSSQLILTGSQDNGTNIWQAPNPVTPPPLFPFASAWTNLVGGDGGFVRIDPSGTTGFSTFGYTTQFVNRIANLGTPPQYRHGHYPQHHHPDANL